MNLKINIDDMREKLSSRNTSDDQTVLNPIVCCLTRMLFLLLL